MATPSLFSTLFGGGEGDVYGDLLTEEQKRRMQQQSMLTLGAKLLQASGPSPQRVNIGQAVGGALLAGQEAYNTAGQNALTQMMTKQKIEEYRRQQALRDRWTKALGVGAAAPTSAAPTGAITPSQALAMPSMPLGPTTQRAAMIGQTPVASMPQANPTSLQAVFQSLTPTQRLVIGNMEPEAGMAKLLEIQQAQSRPMTEAEMQQYGLPRGTAASIDATGKPNVLRQRPAPITLETPTGGRVVTTEDALLGLVQPQTAPAFAPTATVNGMPAPAVSGRPVAARPSGLPPGMAEIMAPALKPEQIIAEARDWDSRYRLPVMQAVQSFSTVKDLIQNGQGGIADYGIVIKAIKALDPTSAVMQGEADSAKSMMSLADRMQSVLDKAQSGGLGSEEARMQLANLARSAVKSAVEVYNSQLDRKRKFYGSKIDAPTLDAMLQTIAMPEGAESPEALGRAVGRTSGGVTPVWDPRTQSWVLK